MKRSQDTDPDQENKRRRTEPAPITAEPDPALLPVEPSLFGSPMLPTEAPTPLQRLRVYTTLKILQSEAQLAIQGVLATTPKALWAYENLQPFVYCAARISLDNTDYIRGWSMQKDAMPSSTLNAHMLIQLSYSQMVNRCVTFVHKTMHTTPLVHDAQDLSPDSTPYRNYVHTIHANALQAQAAWSRAATWPRTLAALTCIALPIELHQLIYLHLYTFKLHDIHRWVNATFDCTLSEERMHILMQNWP